MFYMQLSIYRNNNFREPNIEHKHCSNKNVYCLYPPSTPFGG